MKTRAAAGLLIGLLSVGGDSASGCPVVAIPAPLWDRIARAELIFVGRVVSLTPAPHSPPGADQWDYLDGAVAVIEILETWKGRFANEIRISYSGGLSDGGGGRVAVGDRLVIFAESGETQIRQSREAREAAQAPEQAQAQAAPASADMEDGVPDEEEVSEPYVPSPEDLAFVQEFDARFEASREGRWFLVREGPGCFPVGDDDTGSLRSLVEKAVRISEAGGDSADAGRAWLVEAAALRTTRFLAVQELRALLRSDETSAKDDTSAAKAGVHLTREELGTIADGFIHDPGVDPSVPAVVDLLAEYEDHDLDVTVVSVIEAALAEARPPRWLPEAIRAVVTRAGWRDWGSEIWERHRSDATLRDVWPAVAKDLGLPPAAPGRFHLPVVDMEEVVD